MDNNSFDNQSDQFVLSYELVQLMDWIVKYNPQGLKDVIVVAKDIAKTERMHQKKKREFFSDSDLYEMEELQNSIIDFFTLLEKSLFEIENKQMVDVLIQKQLLPAIERVDTSIYDELTLNSCASETAHKVKTQPKKNAKELFLKELLKRWNPGKRRKN